MVWAGVTFDGKKMPLIFIEEEVKIDMAVYLHLLSKEVAPWIESEYGDTPSSSSKTGLCLTLRTSLKAFVRVLFLSFGPSINGPILERRACTKTFSSVDHLKASLLTAWDTITEEVVHAVCGSALKHFKPMVKAKGAHFKNKPFLPIIDASQ